MRALRLGWRINGWGRSHADNEKGSAVRLGARSGAARRCHRAGQLISCLCATNGRPTTPQMAKSGPNPLAFSTPLPSCAGPAMVCSPKAFRERNGRQKTPPRCAFRGHFDDVVQSGFPQTPETRGQTMAEYDLSKPAPDRSHRIPIHTGSGAGGVALILAGVTILCIVLYAVFGSAGGPGATGAAPAPDVEHTTPVPTD